MGDIDQARLAKRPARGRKATVAALLIAATAWPVWQFSRDAHPGADYASGNALRVIELPTAQASRWTRVRHRAGLCGGQARRAPAGGPRALRGRLPRKVAPPSPSPRPMHQPRRWARAIPWAPGAWQPASRLRTPRASALPDLRRRSRRHPGQRRQRPGLGRRHRPRRLVKRSGAGLEPGLSRSTMWRCRQRRQLSRYTSKRVLVLGQSRAQCAHLRHRAPGRPETRAGTAARAEDPRADHRPAGTAAAALTATTGMRRPICRCQSVNKNQYKLFMAIALR